MDLRRCQSLCSRFIASEDLHGKCVKRLGLSDACKAIYGASGCKFCKHFKLKTLCARLAYFDKDSSALPRRSQVNEVADALNPMPGDQMSSSRLWRASRPVSPSLSLSPECSCHADSPVEFLHNYLCPSPEACDAISFGMENVLFTTVSDCGPAAEVWPGC